MACQRGAQITILSGISKAMGKEKFDEAVGNNPLTRFSSFIKTVNTSDIYDWVPGDGGYLFSGAANRSALSMGQNVIYIGNNKWFGHGPYLNRIKTLDNWLHATKGGNRLNRISRKRYIPKIGLD
jgi:hypothetical protein